MTPLQYSSEAFLHPRLSWGKMNSVFPWTPQWNAEAKMPLAFHGSFPVTPTPGPSCLLNSASLNNPISCTSQRKEAKLLPKGLSVSNCAGHMVSTGWMGVDWFLDWLAQLEYKALALPHVESYTLSQKKKKERKKWYSDSVRKLSLKTIIPPIHLKILDLSSHQLIQTFACKSVFIH